VETLGVLKKRMVTAGRVFCQDGQINIIFGDVHRDLTETMGVPEDRRLHPFLIGSRGGTVGTHEGVLLPKPDGEVFAKLRDFWIYFPINAPEAQPASLENGVAAPENKGAVVAPSPGNMSPATETRKSTPGMNREYPAPAVKKTVEERLTILNALRDKKLITDEEYRAKRQEILNEL
jgi:hypothetical protein